MWFSYDPEDGFVKHETEADAKQRVEILLKECRHTAFCNDEWPEETGGICWGKIHGVLRERIVDLSMDLHSDFVMEAIEPTGI